MKRQPPRARHTEPFWTAPRRAARKRRVRPGEPGRHPIEQCFALLKAMRRSAIALGEGPHIRPLLASHHTQVIWPPKVVDPNPVLRVRPPNFTRWWNRIYIQEGSPLCN